jgi:hypothetical protein
VTEARPVIFPDSVFRTKMHKNYLNASTVGEYVAKQILLSMPNDPDAHWDAPCQALLEAGLGGESPQEAFGELCEAIMTWGESHCG